MNADIFFVIRTASLQRQPLQALRRELLALAKPGRRVILDLSGLDDANALFVRMVVETSSRLRRSGATLKVTGLRNKVAALFELLGAHGAVDTSRSYADVLSMTVAA